MAEAILTHFAQGRVRAASAGAIPHGVSPYALQCLRAHGIATQAPRSKVWGEFFGLYAPPIRFLIALCDVCAAKAHWPEDTLIGHWNMLDPAAVVCGDDVPRGQFDVRCADVQRVVCLCPLRSLSLSTFERSEPWCESGEPGQFQKGPAVEFVPLVHFVIPGTAQRADLTLGFC
jgi:hypothetical protein